MSLILAAMLVAGTAFADEGSRAAAPPQLNIPAFASCLATELPSASVSLPELRDRYQPTRYDFMLPYLAFYPASWPGPLVPFRGAALRRWSGDFAVAEEMTALALAARAESGQMTAPAWLYGKALERCARGDALCGLLVMHNLLRTLGRHDSAVAGGEDLNPDWFRRDRERWIARTPGVARAMISLRADGGGDRFGEWYHFSGIAAYAIHEASRTGSLDDAELAAEMSELLNPLLAGGPEDPAKAEIDRESVEVARAYLMMPPGAPAPLGCEGRSGYVHLDALSHSR